ncbi:MAG: tetratricopeptide repeat protein [Proteobacteria bacterium]|nr:tetratricopeptide repeat protein [Pseudomonadota bacterium]
MTEFLQRLKEPKLVQWALAYVAAAFALIQVLDVVAQRFGWPDALEKLLIVALGVGFFVALVLAWYHGEKGEQKVTRRELLALAVVLAAGGGVLWHFGHPAAGPISGTDGARHDAVRADAGRASAAASSGARDASAQAIPSKSIAVLPFANESGEKDQQYFSDGLSEDLINALSQFDGLKVISRNSSFQFRDSTDSSAVIGMKLGVAHLLEGSVRRVGNKVRISAELVNAADGRNLWSQKYDRPYESLFALQDEITKSVADVLKAKLLEGGGAVVQSDRPPSGDLAAYAAYIKGRSLDRQLGETQLRQAIAHFGDAVRIDPEYAAAYAAMARAWVQLAAYNLGGSAARQAYASARLAAGKALLLDPDLASGHDARGMLVQFADFDWIGAEADFRRALQLAPNDEQAKADLAFVVAALGHPQQAIPLARQAVASNPRSSDANYTLAWLLAVTGELDSAEQLLVEATNQMPGEDYLRYGLMIIQVQRGDARGAVHSAQSLAPGFIRDTAMAMALYAAHDQAAADAALKTLIAKDAVPSAYQIAEVYALRQDPDNAFVWLDRAWANRDPGIGLLLFDPFILRYRHDPRFAAICKKVGLPNTTEAKAMP